MVSYETALKLRSNGFPKPAPTTGQHWYFPNVFNTMYPFPVGSTEYNLAYTNDNPDKGVFAPTAVDILKEIPWTHLMYDAANKHWRVWENYSGQAFYHETNPAEAAAEAWFYEKQRKDKSK